MSRRLRAPGDRLGANLTVVGTLDGEGREPVYIVWHAAFWCPMACKVFASPGRAAREAGILAALGHPNVVRFLGLDDPRHVLMEFLEGPTLRALVRSRRRRRLSVSDAMRVGIHLGSALVHIHERGFLHLDVKPGNVIVVRGRPVLFDLGSARPQSDGRLGRLVGTDPYMSPEQCACGVAGPASDVFGLGATLYEALTGRLPFPHGSRACRYPQTRTAPRALRASVPAIPAALDDLVRACLAREPAERPSLPALLPALHAFIRHGPPMWPQDIGIADGASGSSVASAGETRRAAAGRSAGSAPARRRTVRGAAA